MCMSIYISLSILLIFKEQSGAFNKWVFVSINRPPQKQSWKYSALPRSGMSSSSPRGPLWYLFSIAPCCKAPDSKDQLISKLWRSRRPILINQLCRSRDKWKTGRTAVLRDRLWQVYMMVVDRQLLSRWGNFCLRFYHTQVWLPSHTVFLPR